jgi:hypothetical protein
MEGYIKSLSRNWRHIFKRAVRPGGKIPLNELYESYGKKYNLKPNEDFINWLKEVKLRKDLESWEISLLDDTAPEAVEAPEDDEFVEVSKSEKASSIVNKLSVEEIVNLSVRKAREIVPNINDLKLLKYSLREAHPRANKDSLCRILEKRIKDLEIAR